MPDFRITRTRIQQEVAVDGDTYWAKSPTSLREGQHEHAKQ